MRDLTLFFVLALPALGVSCNIRDPRMEVLAGAGGVAGSAGEASSGARDGGAGAREDSAGGTNGGVGGARDSDGGAQNQAGGSAGDAGSHLVNVGGEAGESEAGAGGRGSGGSELGGGSGAAGAAEEKSQGTPCDGDDECASNHCVDGVCCESACWELCARCDVTGLEGSCEPVSYDPACGELECPQSTDCRNYVDISSGDNCEDVGSCLTDAVCAPSDAEEGTPCRSGTLAGTCDATGGCSVEGLKGLGEACTADDECSSTHCVGATAANLGMCCDAACDGVCEACGSDGHCDAAPEDDARCDFQCPAEEVCATYPEAPAANRCTGFRRCMTAEEYCDPSFLPQGEACGTDMACNGAGECELACPTSTGAERDCSTNCACDTGDGVCASNAECASGLVCASGAGAKFGFAGDTCLPPHCDNDIMDQDETSRDCGGECGCTVRLEWFDTGAAMEGISDDGRIIVGHRSGSDAQAVYWDANLIRHDLGGSRAYAANGDGSVIVGSAEAVALPARWLGLEPDPLPLRETEFSGGTANGVSADGSVVVGTGNDGGSQYGFVWTDGVLTWDYAFQSFDAVSADGSVALGRLTSSEDPWQLALRSPTGTINVLVPSDWSINGPGALSRDGTMVVGSLSDGTGGFAGFLWRAGMDTVLLSGAIDGSLVYPSIVTNTGIVYGQTGRGGMPADYWHPGNGYARGAVVKLLSDHGLELDAEIYLSQPIGATPDGRAIFGTGTNGGYRITFDAVP